MKVNVTIDIDSSSAFELLCKELHADIILDDDNFIDKYSFNIDEYNEIVVVHKNSGEIYDDRGELFLALLHLSTKLFPNTEIRSEMEDPGKLMSKLYKEQKKRNIL